MFRILAAFTNEEHHGTPGGRRHFLRGRNRHLSETAQRNVSTFSSVRFARAILHFQHRRTASAPSTAAGARHRHHPAAVEAGHTVRAGTRAPEASKGVAPAQERLSSPSSAGPEPQGQAYGHNGMPQCLAYQVSGSVAAESSKRIRMPGDRPNRTCTFMSNKPYKQSAFRFFAHYPSPNLSYGFASIAGLLSRHFGSDLGLRLGKSQPAFLETLECTCISLLIFIHRCRQVSLPPSLTKIGPQSYVYFMLIVTRHDNFQVANAVDPTATLNGPVDAIQALASSK